MKRDRDLLAEAIARLKQDGLSHPLPDEIAQETTNRLLEAQTHTPGDVLGDRRRLQPGFLRVVIRPALAAAALILLGYAVGRLTMRRDMDQIREAIAPSVAASIEPTLRESLVEDLRHSYQLALASTYIQLREELTAQYRDDQNRFATQILAASNAATNQLLAELVHTIKAEQNEDRQRISSILHQIELKRLQDARQLASGLEVLAYRTEDELQRTRDGLVQLLVNTYPAAEDPTGSESVNDPNERS